MFAAPFSSFDHLFFWRSGVCSSGKSCYHRQKEASDCASTARQGAGLAVRTARAGWLLCALPLLCFFPFDFPLPLCFPFPLPLRCSGGGPGGALGRSVGG